ncbi:MAG TPA: VWA domain-containing protein [Pyrinomonadaceae bacterium]|jgi:VWFA-related protein
MRSSETLLKRAVCAALFIFCISLCITVTRAQQSAPEPSPAQTPASPPDDIVRISTELVQTDVMVFDKQGRFIDNLKPEDFELRVDGRVQPVSFFERVVAGSSDEETQLAAARGRQRTGQSSAPVRPADRGRTIFFFIDDLHLSQESIMRTRKTLLNYIDREVGQNDQVAITSASGQIGFLQQLTNNKSVLRKAVERLGFRATAVLRDTTETPPMTAVQALEIAQNNQSVLSFFVEALLRDNPMLRPEIAVQMVQVRSRRLVQQSDATNTNLLLTLASLMRSTARLPGRKLVFFLSEGFVMNVRDSDVLEKMRRATDAAARSGTVVYTMNPLGLETGMDATTQAAFDLSGRLPQASTELMVTQEPLRIIASSTGGRALLNTNALDASIGKTLQETSIYYLLAWRPDTEQQKPGKFRRIEAKVIGRPELVVRVRNGYFTTDPATASRPTPPKNSSKSSTAETTKTPEKELRTAINDVFARTTLPTSVFAYYSDQPNNGPVLSLIMAVEPEALELEMKDGKHTGVVDIAGMVFNEEGKSGASFKEQIQLNVIPSDLPRILSSPLFYNYELRIKPGLYQVRVAARDAKTGRTGSAMQWVEIPDLSTQKLTMSSLLVGSNSAAREQAATEQSPVNISVDRRFSRNSRLRFLTYIYNAQRGAASGGEPDVALQVQVFRDDQPVITTALSKVKTEGLPDKTRLPYAAEVMLDKMPAGQYVLKVTAIDRLAKASTSQQVDFAIE